MGVLRSSRWTRVDEKFDGVLDGLVIEWNNLYDNGRISRVLDLIHPDL